MKSSNKRPKQETGNRRSAVPPAVVLELEQRFSQGDPSAASDLGDPYRTGDGVPQDLAAALLWYQRGAEMGDPGAQNNLGTMLLHGMSCEADPKGAVHWYTQSARQGLAVAQYNLAHRLRCGEGAGQDFAQALHWFSKAAKGGDIAAVREPGAMYWVGEGVSANILAAADFHFIAAEGGDDLACRNLAQYADELRALAIAGSQKASLFLSRAFNRGFGVVKSQAWTWAWIRWAQERCVPDADDGIVEEVEESYRFYRSVIPLETRRRGEHDLETLILPAVGPSPSAAQETP
jgi:TPR repeat protein